MSPLIRISSQPNERDLQRYGLVLMGWALLSLVVVATPLFLLVLRNPSGGEDMAIPGYLTPVRAALGIVAVLISVVLPGLTRRHREAIRTVRGARQQFRNAGTMTVVVGLLWIFFWWWLGVVVAVVGLIVRVMVKRIPEIPRPEMTESVEHPTWWKPED
jgi:hypothetical protein